MVVGIEALALSGWNAAALEEALGEGLAGLDFSGAGIGPKDGNEALFEIVDDAAGQRVLRANDDEVDALFLDRMVQAGEVRRRDGDVGAEQRRAGIARRGEDARDSWALGELPGNGVLAGSGADH